MFGSGFLESKHNPPGVRRVVILAILLAAMASTTSAAVFFPDGGTGKSAAVEQLLAKVPPDKKDVALDDMRFPRASLEKSGFTGPLWTNGLVYYQFDPGVASDQRQQWLNAAAEWEEVARVDFRARTNQPNYIYVFSGDGNWSYVGMIGGRQEMSIYNWYSLYIIAHEIGHALGAAHEHQRNDRNSYIQVNLANIQPGCRDEFDRIGTTNYGSYDFDSVMHYDKCAFSIDCLPGYTCSCTHVAITVLPPNQEWQDRIGQRSHLSTRDSDGMAARYGAPMAGPIYVNSGATGLENGSIYYPYHTLSTALTNAAQGGATIVLFAGDHGFAPATINQSTVLTSMGGVATIE